jgi:DNA-binding transcriptional MerR regulator/quercetin dioxygenase-like cupin family protein
MSEIGIGDAARLTQTNASTLRLWEQHGLIAPERTASGHRIYHDRDITRIRTIKRLRTVDGLNMSAIKRVLARDSESTNGAVSSAADRSNDLRQLGIQYRRARIKLGLSLRGAASKSGLPASVISTFERTGLGSTVSSLQRLASIYGTSVTELANPRSGKSYGRPHVIRSGRARQAPEFGQGIQIFQLAETLESLDCQQWVLQPGAQSDGAYSHEGEEFIHVMAGRFEIKIDDQPLVELSVGDSISFNSQLPHSWRAIGSVPTVLLWVNTPRSF